MKANYCGITAQTQNRYYTPVVKFKCVTEISIKPYYMSFLCLPSIEVEIYCFTSHRSFVRHISFVSVRSVRLSYRRSNTRRWPSVGLLLAHRLRRWANISPVLGYRVVFDATLNVGRRHKRRANINPALPLRSSHCTARARARPISLGINVWRTNKRRQPDILAT